ncbi:MAG: EamA family transporter [Armatimonadetes bacterium]|nr:EamA family transporter [Armatimonadota bacterium]
MYPSWLLPALLAIVFWGLWPFFANLGAVYAPYRHVLVFEWLGSTVVTLGVLLSLGGRLDWRPGAVSYGALAGALGLLGALTYLAAVSRTRTPSLVVMATALCPAITLILNRLFLGEVLSPRQLWGVALALVSVLLMVRA